MSTFTDGPSLSVSPGPDESSGPEQAAVPAPTPAPAQNSGAPRRRAAADREPGQGPDWLQQEIQRRIAAKSGSSGRHARRGNQPQSNLVVGYERRHNPEPTPPGGASPVRPAESPVAWVAEAGTPVAPILPARALGTPPRPAPAAPAEPAADGPPTGPTPVAAAAPEVVAPQRVESPSWPATPIGPGLPSIERPVAHADRVRTLSSPASGRAVGVPQRPVTQRPVTQRPVTQRPSSRSARLLSPPASPPATPTGIPIEPAPEPVPRGKLSAAEERELDEAYDAGYEDDDYDEGVDDDYADDVYADEDDEPGVSTGPLPVAPRIGPPPTASPEIEASGEVIWTAVTPANTPPSRSPLAMPSQRGVGSDGVSVTAPSLVAVRPPPSIPIPIVTETPDDEQPVPADGEEQIKRVRVVMAERKTVARPVRTVVDVQEGTGVGQMLRSNLLRSQLGVALSFAAGAVLTLGLLPLLFAFYPQVSAITILGIRLPWLLLGFLVYPFLLGLGWWHTRTAERVEQNFADHVQD